MARDLFIDLTNNRLAASETNLAPAGPISFTKGDTGTWNLYFLEATGVINNPFVIVDKSAASVKVGIGSRTGTPTSGTWTMTFGGDTTGGLSYAITAGGVQSALNGLTAISSAGGVTVDGTLETHFTVRFNNAGSRGPITANVSELIPDTIAVIDERIAGSGSAKEIQEIQLRLTPAVYQPTWTDLSTTVTATIATTVTGSSTLNEVQRLSFTQEPYEGTYRLTFPAATLTSTSTVTNGVFITTTNHGLALNQPVTITGFDTTITGYTRGTTYYVKTTPEATQFTVAATAGGTLITGSATAITTSGTISTILRQTAPIDADASAADVQAALEALDSIGSGGMIVSGIQGQYYDMAFSGQKGYADLPLMTVQSGLSAKKGKTADIDFSTFALRDLLQNNTSSDLELEIELTEGGKRTTVVLSSCTVAEELIDADAFSPTVAYPSFIFQALTATAANATTSLIAITGLNWTAQANSEYLVEWSIHYNTGLTYSTKNAITYPVGASLYGTWLDQATGSLSYSSTNLTSEFEMEPQSAQILQKGYLKTGTTAGTVSFLIASSEYDTSAAAVTGSWVRVEKIA